MNRGWLLAEVEAGQFDDENVVVFTDANDRTISLIAPRSLISVTDGRSRVAVRLLDSRQGVHLIELPGEVFGHGREVVVRNEEVELQDPR